MDVIFKKKRYKKNTIICLKIEFYKFILAIRRMYRRLKILLNYVKKYNVVIIILILYLFLIGIIGFKYDHYNNIEDFFWDNRLLIITNLLLPYSLFAFREIKDRHEKLISTIYYYRYLSAEIYNYYLFFLNNIKEYNNVLLLENLMIQDFYIKIDEKSNLKTLHNNLDLTLQEMLESSKANELEYDISPLILNLKLNNNKILNKYKKNKMLTNSDIEEFQFDCNVLIHNICWEWKKDRNVDEKINKLLNK